MLVDDRGQPISSETDPAALTREQLNEALSMMAEALVEADVTASDIELIRDVVGWDRVGARGRRDMDDSHRTATVEKARLYHRWDAASKQLLRLWTNFGIHKGFSARARSVHGQEVIKGFWRGRANRQVFGINGQRQSSDLLLVEGEIPFAVGWPNEESVLKVRRFDPLEITKIVTNPDDGSEVWYYGREFTDQNSKRHKFWYEDLYAPKDKEKPGAFKALKDFNKPQNPPKIYFMAWDTIGLRGNSLLATVLDWSKAHRKFMEARSAIEQALAKFAWKHKIKGGAAAVAKRIAELQSGYVTGDQENKPPPAPGSDWVENQGYDLTQFKVDTGAGNAQIDGGMLIMMVGLGAGIYPQYMGAGESFRLATATTMELPMLKMFESYQYVWIGTYKELIDYAAEYGRRSEAADIRERRQPGIVEEKPADIEIEVQPIVTRDVPRVFAALAKVFIQIPELAADDDVREWILRMMGLAEPKAVAERIRKRPPIPKPVPIGQHVPPGPLPERGGNGAKQEATVAAIEALRQLSEAMVDAE